MSEVVFYCEVKGFVCLAWYYNEYCGCKCVQFGSFIEYCRLSEFLSSYGF